MSDNIYPSIGQLNSIIHRSSFSFFNIEANEALGLSYGQFFVLHNVIKHPGLSQHEIQEYLGRDKGNVSVLIKELMKKGFLNRAVDEVDKRVFRVSPTEKALALENEIQRILKKWTELLLLNFSPGERLMLFEFLERLVINIEENI